MGQGEDLKITNIVDGVLDLKRNASDFSRLVFEQCLRHQSLCIAVSMLLHDPTEEDPIEAWKFATYFPTEKHALHPEFEKRVRHAMRYTAENVKRILSGEILSA